MPDLAIGNGMVHVPEKFPGMMAGIEDPVVLANQLLTGVLADRAELIIYRGDRTLDICDGNDGVLIQGKLLIGQLFQRRLPDGGAFLKASSVRLRSLISVRMATYLIGLPSLFRVGTTVVSTQ